MPTKLKYLEGLNTLRFFAAFFVIISHANLSLYKLGICKNLEYAFLNRGADAVDFFFTLSGFLITYLLIIELNETKTISIKNFYLRRVYRIWPLYFLIVLLGFLFFGAIYPVVYKKPYFSFSIPEGLAMFVLFIPNYAAKNYAIGFLNPLWSIGVEEQFYLFWAPLTKLLKKWLLQMIISFVLVSTSFYILLYNDIFRFPPNWQYFLLTQKFYAMSIGAVFAYLLYYQFDRYEKSLFPKKYIQFIVLLIIIWHYTVGFSFSSNLYFKILLSFLYGILILNVSVIKNKLVNLEKRWLTYLGVISYGLYMYHMLIDYVLRLSTEKIAAKGAPSLVLIPLYYILLIAGSIVIASFSHRYFEKYFLNLKYRLAKH
jgi:peptidoglycan/LPS O-acetylase OafA/YrhL